ncbi:hypothetical protein CRYUN_Cryun40dG0000800 [Craigia yunnanensis]
MPAKKLIAICQSGGDFVTNKYGSLSYNGGEAYAVDIDQQTRLSDFKSEIAEMFNFSSDNMSVKNFLPGNKKTSSPSPKTRICSACLIFLETLPPLMSSSCQTKLLLVMFPKCLLVGLAGQPSQKLWSLWLFLSVQPLG